MVSDVREAIAEEHTEYDSAASNAGKVKAQQARFKELFLERAAQYNYPDFLQMVKSCYVDAGYSVVNNNGIMFRARKLLEQLWPELEQDLHTSLKGGAALGLNTLVHLCVNAKQEAVRLKAATELLNKGGFAETQKIELKSVEDMSDEELQKQIREKMAEQGLKVVRASEG